MGAGNGDIFHRRDDDAPVAVLAAMRRLLFVLVLLAADVRGAGEIGDVDVAAVVDAQLPAVVHGGHLRVDVERYYSALPKIGGRKARSRQQWEQFTASRAA